MHVKVMPDGVSLEVTRGKNLLAALTEGGIRLDASCGGAGVCGQCRVRLISGGLEDEPGGRVTGENYAAGWRQACLCRISGDCVIEIPVESRLESEFVLERKPVPSGQYLTEQQLAALNPEWKFDPPMKKFFIRLPHPTNEDNVPDMTRLARGLRHEYGIKHLQMDLEILRELPTVLREGNWEVTVTVIWSRAIDAFLEPQERGARQPRLVQKEPGVYQVHLAEQVVRQPIVIRVEPGDTRHRNFSLALDIGTTTISGQVVDLNSGRPLCTLTEYNAQAAYGADVISRVLYTLKPNGLETMQKLVVETINRVIGQLSESCGVQPSELSHLAGAGNTVMTHLLLKLTPKWLRESPYVPVINRAGSVVARELGIEVAPRTRFYTFPCVASYVGGDIVAGVLACGLYKRKNLALFMDIGTNAEIVVGNRDFLLTASCSAGPAFEGGGITAGMHAGPGAIERFYVDPRTFAVRFDTIRRKPARGICGSGLINAVASLFLAGLIEPNAKVNLSAPTPLVRQGLQGPEILIAPAERTESGKDIVLTEADLNNLLRAKAAMFAGYTTLLEHTGLSFNDCHEIFIAGNFGNTLDIENAITIGLLPDIDRDKFKFVGNASLYGAALVTKSSELLHDAELVAKMLTNVEFWDNPVFMEYYLASMFLPHTDAEKFPSVAERLRRFRAGAENGKTGEPQ